MPWGENFSGLLAALRMGREWSWEAVYRELGPPLLGYLRAGGAAEPEDLLGEVFLQAVRDLHRFDGGEEAFRAWAFTIAHNRLIDERRRSGRRPVDPAATVPDKEVGGDVEEEALATLGDERVHRLLARLSFDQRSVLVMRVVGDLTVEQVADALGRTPGAVKALQRRALTVLRQELPRLDVTL